MAYLIINAGSSSMKLSIFNSEDVQASRKSTTAPPQPVWKAHLDGLGKDGHLTVENAGQGKEKIDFDASDPDFLAHLIDRATANHAVHGPIEAVGHRVVHGGNKYSQPVLIDDSVVEDLESLTALDPEHVAAAIKGVKTARKALPSARHVAVFDTAFHHDMPLAAQLYPVPYKWFAEMGIRRFGFHGINHQFCSGRAEALLDKSGCVGEKRVIICHLGSGASLCATLGGRSVMTTMGYTPLEGIVMSTRSGSIDPGLVLYMVRSGYFSAAELNKVLNEDSGLKGLFGVSGDMRKIEESLDSQDAELQKRALLTFEIYIQRLTAAIASLVPTLGGLDALVFTGGIGENSSLVRASACATLAFLGVAVDDRLNGGGGSGGGGGDAAKKSSIKPQEERDISTENASVRTFIIPAGEEITIARALLTEQ